MPHHNPSMHKEHAKGRPQTRTRKSEKESKEVSFFDLLEKEHTILRSMLEDVSHEGSETRLELFSEIENQLKMHMEKEEQFFYPVLEKSSEALILVMKAYEEHKAAKNILGEFEELSPADAAWEAKFLVLKHLVTDHVDSEEEELFPLAKKEMNGSQVRKVTQSILAFERSAQPG